jgi:isopenicillin N synthase-like dioxygenase
MTTGTLHVNDPSSSGSLTDFDRIPIIDLSGMFEDDFEAKERIAGAVRTACTDVGFFYIINHGVPEDLINRRYEGGL